MDSSSEDSFAWTDTSSDSIESQNMGLVEKVEEKTESHNKNEKKKKLKKLLNNVSNSDHDESDSKRIIKIEKEQSSDESYRLKKNKVKMEPESENEVPKKKKKKKCLEIEKSEIDEQGSESYDESFLNIKVKEENMCPPPHKTKKKKKHKSVSVDCNDSTAKTFHNNSSYQSSMPDKNGTVSCDSDNDKSRKKKKRTKRESHQDDSDSNDKMDVEVMKSDTSHINNKSDIKLYMTSVADSYTLQDETNCSEISAIQGDENDSLHTLTPSDSKSTAKIKKNNSLHKSVVLNQFEIDQVSQKRMPRISDRIMFEEYDEETELHTNIDNQISSRLQKCLKDNSNYQRVSQEIPSNVGISDDDEIWLIKCPSEIDVEAFLGTEFNTDAKFKIKVCGQTYDGSLGDEQPYPATLLQMNQKRFELKNVPVLGTIHLRKRVPKAHFRYDNVIVNNQTNFIPLPEVKCRHPLFGSNYKKAVKIPPTIAEKLNLENNDEATMNVKKQKKKKHKKSRSEVDEASVANEVNITKCEPNMSLETAGKKRKKLKHAEDDNPLPKRAKRNKHHTECSEAWESEKAIEKTLFDF